MINKLFAYNIDGVSVNNLTTYTTTALNGNEPFIISSEPEINGYTDITSIENWYKFGDSVLEDYQEKQKAIKLAGYDKGWENATNEERNILIDFYANPQFNTTNNEQNTQNITHLMTVKGLSYSEAVDYIVDSWWDYWTNFLVCCNPRWRKAVKVSVKYLNLSFDLSSSNSPESSITFKL